MNFRFTDLRVQVWRGLFVLILTTLIFYTNTGLRQSPANQGHVMSMSASVPRREAPPPPPIEESCRTPKTILLRPILDQHTPILLNLFYRIGQILDADFYLDEDWQNGDWRIPNSERNSIIICLEDCNAKMTETNLDLYSISILRDPVKVFRESFTLTFTTQMAFKRSGNDLETFLSRPNDFYSPEDPNAYRAKNFLSHAFGVENDESISFKRLSMQFDFVIIAEYLLESLLLLKDELCLSYEALLFLYHSDDYEISKVSQMNAQIRKWNELDTSLYDHFNETLWSEISEYGLDEIEYEKKNYESQLSRVRTICRDILLESDREFCAEINLSDLDILKAVKESQREL